MTYSHMRMSRYVDSSFMIYYNRHSCRTCTIIFDELLKYIIYNIMTEYVSAATAGNERAWHVD